MTHRYYVVRDGRMVVVAEPDCEFGYDRNTLRQHLCELCGDRDVPGFDTVTAPAADACSLDT